MHGTINVKSPNNISRWQMGFNSAFKGLIFIRLSLYLRKNSNITICNKNFVLFLKSSRQVQCSEEWMSRVINLNIINFLQYIFFL
jgi:hypothetical protein